MGRYLIIALLITFPAAAQSNRPADAPLTSHEQIKADRAKAADVEKSAPTTRPWDRDANGKRPWERNAVSGEPAVPTQAGERQ